VEWAAQSREARWRCQADAGRSHLFHVAQLSLCGDACGIVDFDPDVARAGSIRAIDLHRHDALGAKPASIGEHGGSSVMRPEYCAGAAPAQPSGTGTGDCEDHRHHVRSDRACRSSRVGAASGRRGLSNSDKPSGNRFAVDREGLGCDAPGSSRNVFAAGDFSPKSRRPSLRSLRPSESWIRTPGPQRRRGREALP
jgi:hypothetical protein